MYDEFLLKYQRLVCFHSDFKLKNLANNINDILKYDEQIDNLNPLKPVCLYQNFYYLISIACRNICSLTFDYKFRFVDETEIGPY